MPPDDVFAGTCPETPHYRVHLCFGPNCSARGSRELMPVLERAVREAGLTGQVELLATTCRNRCDFGPSLNVYPGPTFYNGLDERGVRDIVQRHLANGDIVGELVFRPPLVKDRGDTKSSLEGSPAMASVTVTHVPGTTYQTRIETADLA